MKFKKLVLLGLAALISLNIVACSGEDSKVVDYLKLGEQYLEDGEYDEAIDAFEDALDKDEYVWAAYSGLMVAMKENQEPQEDINEVVLTSLDKSVEKERDGGIDSEEIDELIEMYEITLNVTEGDDEIKLEILITTNDVLKEENEFNEEYIEHLEIMAQKYWENGDKDKAEELMGRLEEAGVEFEIAQAYAEKNGMEFKNTYDVNCAVYICAVDTNGNYDENASQYYKVENGEISYYFSVTEDASKEGYVNLTIAGYTMADVTASNEAAYAGAGGIFYKFAGSEIFDYYSGKNLIQDARLDTETDSSVVEVEWNGEMHEITCTAIREWDQYEWEYLEDGSFSKWITYIGTITINMPEGYDGICVGVYDGEYGYEEAWSDYYGIKDRNIYFLDAIQEAGRSMGDYTFIRVSEMVGE